MKLATRRTRVVVGYEIEVGAPVRQADKIVGKVVAVTPVHDAAMGDRFALDIDLWDDVTEGYTLPSRRIGFSASNTSRERESLDRTGT